MTKSLVPTLAHCSPTGKEKPRTHAHLVYPEQRRVRPPRRVPAQQFSVSICLAHKLDLPSRKLVKIQDRFARNWPSRHRFFRKRKEKVGGKHSCLIKEEQPRNAVEATQRIHFHSAVGATQQTPSYPYLDERAAVRETVVAVLRWEAIRLINMQTCRTTTIRYFTNIGSLRQRAGLGTLLYYSTAESAIQPS
jgi:hypothetical protein